MNSRRAAVNLKSCHAETFRDGNVLGDIDYIINDGQNFLSKASEIELHAADLGSKHLS
jgi:hypothetical protein